MLSKLLLVVALCFSFASPAIADQYAYVTLPQATQAMEVIRANRQVHSFCAPCGDRTSRPINVVLVEIGRIWEGHSAVPYQSDGESYWEVLVNDESVDLAYLYVRKNKEWQNLAILLGLDASQVPEYLNQPQLGE